MGLLPPHPDSLNFQSDVVLELGLGTRKSRTGSNLRRKRRNGLPNVCHCGDVWRVIWVCGNIAIRHIGEVPINGHWKPTIEVDPSRDAGGQTRRARSVDISDDQEPTRVRCYGGIREHL